MVKKKKIAGRRRVKKEPAVRCEHACTVDAEGLVPHPRNPNRHPEEQIKMLAKAITSQGWRHPVVVSNLSGYVVAGHGRLEAALSAGWKKIPIDRQDFANEQEELAHMVADNRLPELASFDGAMLKDLLEELSGGEGLDMEGLGFDEATLEGLMRSVSPPDDFPEVDENLKTEHECPKCGYVWSGGAS